MKDLVILGGGTAGWLTALYLNKRFPGNKISVIEDPNRPPIIAGESGGSSIIGLYKFLEIDFNDWVVQTGALPKLGGKFFNWNGDGESFTHGLVDQYYDLEFNNKLNSLVGVNRDFLRCCIAENISVEDIFYNARLIEKNKLPIVYDDQSNSFVALDTPMWHFDSRANAAYLKNLGLSKNITLIEGEYVSCQRSENGKILSLSLINDQTVYADWFFDCSGFARLLVEKELKIKFKDHSKLFPARSVVAWWDENPKLINYTAVTAMKYGWSWNINLKERSGNGYVFDPDHISVEQAIEEAENTFSIKINPIAKLNFTPSIIDECWKENVIGIGLSTGFLEPLESNGLAQVVIQLELLDRFWSPESSCELERIMFNKDFSASMNEILNFLLLHYKGSRRDTDFWKDHARLMDRYTDSLHEYICSCKDGNFVEYPELMRIYSMESYTAVLSGLNLIDRQKLQDKLKCQNIDLYREFQKSLELLNNKILDIEQRSMDMETWYKLTYGEKND